MGYWADAIFNVFQHQKLLKHVEALYLGLQVSSPLAFKCYPLEIVFYC